MVRMESHPCPVKMVNFIPAEGKLLGKPRKTWGGGFRKDFIQIRVGTHESRRQSPMKAYPHSGVRSSGPNRVTR